jgi:hypothetical protein
VTDEELEIQFVSQLLQRYFPESRAMGVAATPIRGDQHLFRMWESLLGYLVPPTHAHPIEFSNTVS